MNSILYSEYIILELKNKNINSNLRKKRYVFKINKGAPGSIIVKINKKNFAFIFLPKYHFLKKCDTGMGHCWFDHSLGPLCALPGLDDLREWQNILQCTSA